MCVPGRYHTPLHGCDVQSDYIHHVRARGSDSRRAPTGRLPGASDTIPEITICHHLLLLDNALGREVLVSIVLQESIRRSSEPIVLVEARVRLCTDRIPWLLGDAISLV